MSRADIAIVGAGPAGAWAAGRLARAGARVLLFDPSHPREKPCGGGVTARAVALISPEVDASALPAVAIRSAVFEGGDGVRATVSLSDRATGPLLVLSRQRFDAALLEAAVQSGATFVRDRVIDVRVDPGGAEVQTRGARYRCDWLIGADGATSLVRRRVWRPFRRAQLSVASGFYAEAATSTDIVIKFIAHPPGYIWSFPRPDHLAVGICAQADETDPRGLLDCLRTWMTSSGLAPGARLRAYSWPIPSLAARDLASEPAAGPRWLLLGDAAGLVDPITREGIFFALQSASFAADAVLSGAAVAGGYTARLRDTIVPELTRAARLKRGFFRPQFIRLVVDGLSRSRGIRSVMADLVAGEQTYAALPRRLLATLEVGLAMRLLRMRLGYG